MDSLTKENTLCLVKIVQINMKNTTCFLNLDYFNDTNSTRIVPFEKKSDLNSPRTVLFFKKEFLIWKKEDDLIPFKMGYILVLIWIHFKWTANQHLKENCSIDELKRDSQICNTRGSKHNSWHNMSQRRAAIICAISSIFFFVVGENFSFVSIQFNLLWNLLKVHAIYIFIIHVLAVAKMRKKHGIAKILPSILLGGKAL